MTLTTLLLCETDQKVTYRAQGAGEALVLIHGVGMQSAAWAPQMDHFAETHRVIAIDMPGHGGSDPLPVGSQLEDYVAWCGAVIETLGVGPVNLVGHSMGALIAGGIAATHPQCVQRVALLNGVFLRDAQARTAVQARAAEIRDGNIDLETPLARWFDAHQHAARTQVAGWLNAVDPVGYATAYTAFAHGDAVYAARLSTVGCPFLAMTGDGDPNSTPAMTRAMAEIVQDGWAVTIDGHRHMVNLTAADQVNAHLDDWLTHPIQTKEMQ
jgi:pimeloyl-ACP methyl ester carboxylesterase